MKKKQILYACPICKEIFPTVKGAEACRDQPFDMCGWEVGEALLIPQESIYVKVESPWFAFEEPAWPESTSHFDHQPKYHYWFVVVALRGERRAPHRPTITVFSGRGTIPGRGGHHSYGWNPANGDGHNGLYRPGSIDGRTAQGCSIHLPKYAYKKDYIFLKKMILAAKPPKGLMDLPETKEIMARLADPDFHIPLL